jgi:Fe-S cluster biogenesis protein NfuA
MKKKKVQRIFHGTTKIERKQKLVVEHVPITQDRGAVELEIQHMMTTHYRGACNGCG